MSNILSIIVGKLKEGTTWSGIFLVLTAAGVTLSPELMEAIISVGVGAAGLVLVVMNELKKEDIK